MFSRLRTGFAAIATLAIVVTTGDALRGTPPPEDIVLTPLGVYRTGLYDEGAVEIAAYDPVSRRAFVTFAERPEIRIVDLSDPRAPVEVTPSIDLTPWGEAAHATSVAVANGVLVAAVPQGADDTAPGKVLFFDTDGALLSQVTVGALPDMVTFSPNGALALTANEGQPNQSYTYDPDGSISVIDVSRGAANVTQADVTDITFEGLTRDALDQSVRILRPGATVAQDLEPEYVAVSHDSRTAWVTLQENNAVAIVDLQARRLVGVRGLGYKNHGAPGAGLDAGRDDGTNLIRTWPVLGMYQPDAIAAFRVGGRTYLATANEGDVREYDGLDAPKEDDTDEEAVEVEDIVLDPNAFPDRELLQNRSEGIGRLNVTSFAGDDDGDGDYDRLFAFGARSFSILTDDGTRIFDSGDAIERITRAASPMHFNVSNTNNTRDSRSGAKGPEPEGITAAHLFGRTYLFVMLERIGGVLVYEVVDPAHPRFVQYINTRDFEYATRAPEAGDLGPEAARVIPAEFSPNGQPLLLVSNEVSGTLRVFAIQPVR